MLLLAFISAALVLVTNDLITCQHARARDVGKERNWDVWTMVHLVYVCMCVGGCVCGCVGGGMHVWVCMCG